MKKTTLLLLVFLSVTLGARADVVTVHSFDLTSGWTTDGSVVSYSSNTITSTAGYSGYLQNWCEGSGYKASKFILTTESAAGLKVSVYYTSGSSSDIDASEISNFEIDLDPTRVIQKIQIQTKAAESTGIVLTRAVLEKVVKKIDLSKFDAGAGVTWNTSTLTATFPSHWGNNFIQDWSNLNGKYAEKIIVNNVAAANYQVDGQYTDETSIAGNRIYNATTCTVTLDPTKAIHYIKVTCTNDKGEEVTFTNAYMELTYLSGFTTTSITNGGKAPVYFYKSFKEGWNSFCVPFAMPIEDIAADAQAYTFTSYDGSSTATFTKVEKDTLSAGVPYLLKLSAATTIGKLYEDKTLSSTITNPTASNKMSFKGNYTAGMDMEGKWGVTSDKIMEGDTGSKLKAFAAYFEVATTARELNIAIDDDATGISLIDNGPLTIDNASGAWYSLDGRKYNAKPTAKGLYIVNGKKVIIK